MSKDKGVRVCAPLPDDAVVVGFSPVVSQAGGLQQAAAAQSLAIANQTMRAQSQDTQGLANCAKSTNQALKAGSLKSANRLLRTINALNHLNAAVVDRDE
ncbi:MAG: hypothetical protein JJ850_01515 [Kordiimonadaceae bacterium]|nr:hypothetical protein [Kordiimonadaceae bacterium]MBO6567521.1 hypothetical protein [Kordiimonadaceae bacterium]MBO6963265.1 hypothetical protein [Kordiimonadaceae bacterium]